MGKRFYSIGVVEINKQQNNIRLLLWKKLKNAWIGRIIGTTSCCVIGGALIFTKPMGLVWLLVYVTEAVIGGGDTGGGIIGGMDGWIKRLFN